MLRAILAFFAVACACLYIWQRKINNFWKRNHVKYIKAMPIFGNMKEILCLKRSLGDQLWELYKLPEVASESVVGIRTPFRPALLIRDVELAKNILIKDFNSFSNRVLRTDPVHDPIGNYNLFFLRNPEWRMVRSKTSPVFTSGKIKQLYPLMQEVGRELEAFLSEHPNNTVLELKGICERFTTDLIATVAFGMKANAIRNPKSEFYMQCRSVFALTYDRFFHFFVFQLVPRLGSLLRLKLFSKKTRTFLRSNMERIFEERERTGTTRHDLIDALMDMKRKALQEPGPPTLAANFDCLVAQAALFQTAGYDTSASTMAFALFELAFHPEMQERLRTEIKEAFENGNGDISYNDVQEMAYLGQVADETLRKYPILAFLDRECTPEAGAVGYSLKPYSDYVVPAGMPIYISIIGFQRDEKYWSDPERFDPERFALENREQLCKEAYLPFGSGPHNCIGMRIGLLQAKMGLIHLLKNYRVVRCEKTQKSIEFDPRAFNMTTKGGVYMRIERD